jgi:phenylpropionate dioxygenase-like ring-hydroxylating dioxygenase large terminal subunit
VDQIVTTGPARAWADGLTRVPFWVYQDPAVHDREQNLLFEGPVWNFLCLETEISSAGDWRTTYVGRMPVVVVRTENDGIAAFENRCAHRGALICFDNAGKGAKDFTCVYHSWRYDLYGTLRSVAFQRGVNGKGGMPPDFRPEQYGPRKLRVATLCGLVFGTLSPDTPDIESYLGPEVLDRIRRVAGRKMEVIGRFTEVLPNNWKLYAENARDAYHASLLHVFFATFRINRLSQKGGLTVSPDGGSHVAETFAPDATADITYAGLRSVDDELRLSDPRMLNAAPEHNDGIQQQIITIFPNLAVVRTRNALAVRHFLPRGTAETDLHWRYFGYADDSPELRASRLRQLNLTGPAGFISLEDGCIGGFIERGIAAAADHYEMLQMGGEGTESQDNRVSESAIRGFWRKWREVMAI